MSPTRWVPWITLAWAFPGTPVPVRAQHADSVPPRARVQLAASERYRAGWLHRLLLGAHYRDLWATPLSVDVLDLATYAGGLTPTACAGRRQTKSVRLQGADHLEYVFRSVDKDPTLALPPELRRTFARDLLQDQISSGHPGAPLVVAPLLEATGVLHATPALYAGDEAFPVGGSKTLVATDHDDVTLIGAGITLHECLAAHDILGAEGITARVIDCYSVKPIDAQTVRRALGDTGAIVVVEDHRVEGGLGDAVLAALAATGPLHGRVAKLGVAEIPGSATPTQLRAWAKIDAAAIAQRAREVVAG